MNNRIPMAKIQIQLTFYVYQVQPYFPTFYADRKQLQRPSEQAKDAFTSALNCSFESEYIRISVLYRKDRLSIAWIFDYLTRFSPIT
jgi:hypothetical protein